MNRGLAMVAATVISFASASVVYITYTGAVDPGNYSADLTGFFGGAPGDVLGV